MAGLKPLKIAEVKELFAILDRGDKGFIDADDLAHAYALLGAEQKELGAALEHLVKAGYAGLSADLPEQSEGLSYGHAGQRPDRMDLVTFHYAVNHTLATNSLEVLLKATFDRLSGSQAEKRVKVPALMDLAAKFGLKMSRDSEVRLRARVPEEGLDFAGFVNLITIT